MARDHERNRFRSVWRTIVSRCTNPHDANFKRYGARGVHMLREWVDNFDAFAMWVDRELGPRPTQQHQLDRIDNDKGYEPGNLRWATRTMQARNRRDTVKLTHNGESLSIPEWAERLGISYKLLHERRTYGWSDEKILTTPVRSRSGG